MLFGLIQNAEICAQKHHQAMMTNLKRYLTQPLTHTVVSVAEQAECGNEVDQVLLVLVVSDLCVTLVFTEHKLIIS